MSGNVTPDGEALGLGARARARAGIAYVPQGREIFPATSVAEDPEVGFACQPRADGAAPGKLFEMFPLLRRMRSRRGGNLSGGQQQRLAIARALVTLLHVLLLDEPTERIQPAVVDRIGTVIAGLRDRGGMAIVLVEQRFDVAWRLTAPSPCTLAG